MMVITLLLVIRCKHTLIRTHSDCGLVVWGYMSLEFSFLRKEFPKVKTFQYRHRFCKLEGKSYLKEISFTLIIMNIGMWETLIQTKLKGYLKTGHNISSRNTSELFHALVACTLSTAGSWYWFVSTINLFKRWPEFLKSRKQKHEFLIDDYVSLQMYNFVLVFEDSSS